jgi:tetratricopeptide (TPR) repeat protein
MVGCGGYRAYRQGEEFAENEKWDSAVIKYQEAVKKNPGKTEYKIKLIRAKLRASEYHYQLAMMAMNEGNINIAIDELEDALRYNPFNKSAIYTLTKIRNKKQALELHKKGIEMEQENKLESAFNTLDSALKLDSENEIIKTLLIR